MVIIWGKARRTPGSRRLNAPLGLLAARACAWSTSLTLLSTRLWVHRVAAIARPLAPMLTSLAAWVEAVGHRSPAAIGDGNRLPLASHRSMAGPESRSPRALHRAGPS